MCVLVTDIVHQLRTVVRKGPSLKKKQKTKEVLLTLLIDLLLLGEKMQFEGREGIVLLLVFCFCGWFFVVAEHFLKKLN